VWGFRLKGMCVEQRFVPDHVGSLEGSIDVMLWRCVSGCHLPPSYFCIECVYFYLIDFFILIASLFSVCMQKECGVYCVGLGDDLAQPC
jgi:hypothetical protein